MKRLTFTLAAIVIANFFSTEASAGCRGGGGYRAPIHAFSAPHVYRPAPIYRHVIRQPAQTIRPINIAVPPTVTHSTRQGTPQIRLAPTQRVNRNVTPAVPEVSQNPQVARTPEKTPQATTPSALAILAGQQTTTQTQQQPRLSQSRHFGTWMANAPNNASVTLSLNEGGSFSWVAKKDGQISRFDGRFTISDGKLTLSRSSDNQKLAGQLTFSENGFNFKLDGAEDSGLDFRQQS